MKNEMTIRRTILAMALAAFGASGTALAGTFNAPEPLEIGPLGAATVTGSISSSSDVDFYSFEVLELPCTQQPPHKIAIDIDNTVLPDGIFRGHDIVFYVLDPAGTKKFTGQNSTVVDSGSVQLPGWPVPMTLDPYLDFCPDTVGTWKIAVASMPVLVSNGGSISNTARTMGPYTLTVSGLKPSMQEINIDIKPGNNEVSVLNPKSKGVIPVALLSDKDFDPFEVDPASLTFGQKGDEPSLQRCAKDGRDLNGDGKPDRVCFFDNEKTGFDKTQTVAKMKGKKGGKAFQGTGDLKVVPQKHDE